MGRAPTSGVIAAMTLRCDLAALDHTQRTRLRDAVRRDRRPNPPLLHRLGLWQARRLLTGRRTAALIPGSRLLVYEGSGHGLYAADHARLNPDVLAFIGEERALAA
jgi:non-heme chloroperoxidase